MTCYTKTSPALIAMCKTCEYSGKLGYVAVIRDGKIEWEKCPECGGDRGED